MKHLRKGFFMLPLFLAGCFADETISGYADPEATYVLTHLNGNAFPARATIRFAEPGKITGSGPCNAWFATQTAPYPWFEAGPIGATRRACPEIETEGQFFTAINEMTLAEVQGTVVILSNDLGQEMVFTASH